MGIFKKKTANRDAGSGTLRLFFFSNDPAAVGEMQRCAPLLPKNSMELIGTAGQADRAIRDMNRLKPNVLIMDIDTPQDTDDCFSMLRKRKYNTYIVAATGIREDEHKRALLDAGVAYVHQKGEGYMLWDVITALKMLGYFQFPRGFDQQIIVEYKDTEERN